MEADGRGMARLNYDEIAELYDEPARDHDVDPQLLAFLKARADLSTSSVRVLDIGCGTGKQLAANRSRFPGITLVGVARFRGMLRIAQRRCPEVTWVQGDGACLPLASDAFDYITNQYSYPHIGRPGRFLGEVCRTLARGGRFVMTHIDPWAMPGWLVYRYFPEAFELDQQDFVPVERFVALMQDAGFEDVHMNTEELPREETLGEFCRHVSDRHRMSQLMAISHTAYAEGLRRIERDLANAPDGELIEPSRFVRITIPGEKPQV